MSFVIARSTPAVSRKQLGRKPRVIVASHKNPKSDDGSRVVSATRQYILDFEELAEKATSATALHDAMLARYPDWLQPRRALEFCDRRKALT